MLRGGRAARCAPVLGRRSERRCRAGEPRRSAAARGDTRGDPRRAALVPAADARRCCRCWPGPRRRPTHGCARCWSAPLHQLEYSHARAGDHGGRRGRCRAAAGPSAGRGADQCAAAPLPARARAAPRRGAIATWRRATRPPGLAGRGTAQAAWPDAARIDPDGQQRASAAVPARRSSESRIAAYLERAGRGGPAWRRGWPCVRHRASRWLPRRRWPRCPALPQGRVSVQDASAQLAAALLAPQPGERVLDACAAPGGKTGALLELAAVAIELTALDIDAARLRARRRQPQAPGARGAPGARRPARPRRLVGRPAVRSHPARCPLLRHRRDPPPSRHQAAAARRPTSAASPPGSSSCSQRLLAAAAARRAAAVCRPARCCRPRTTAWSRPCAGRRARGAGARWSRRPPRHSAAAARAARHGLQLLPGAGGDGFYYACLTGRGHPKAWACSGHHLFALLAAAWPLLAVRGARAEPARWRSRDPLRLRGARATGVIAAQCAHRLPGQRAAQRRAQGWRHPEFRSRMHRQPAPRASGSMRAADPRCAARALLPRRHRPLPAAEPRRAAQESFPTLDAALGGVGHGRGPADRWSTRSCGPMSTGRSRCAPACAAGTCPTRCGR